MVKISLEFKAQLLNITNLRPDGEDFRWYFRESVPLTGGRGHANYKMKCKFCKKEASIGILQETITPYNAEDSGKYKSMAQGFVAEGEESGTPFTVEFEDKEWCDYDAQGKCEVSITELDFKFKSVK
ncbi:hypothetical protein KUTeg_014845 [Tegillarca granosa]|uniref:CXXC motif containing zinc binding protein n=1 Tax=Tegillarca granosa TaxID=220873 RepID=A0ABQ9ERC3_TEGGR|nr:hypothetical protein KUTeg_014845 [Tegillarca granosa]